MHDTASALFTLVAGRKARSGVDSFLPRPAGGSRCKECARVASALKNASESGAHGKGSSLRGKSALVAWVDHAVRGPKWRPQGRPLAPQVKKLVPRNRWP